MITRCRGTKGWSQTRGHPLLISSRGGGGSWCPSATFHTDDEYQAVPDREVMPQKYAPRLLRLRSG